MLFEDDIRSWCENSGLLSLKNDLFILAPRKFNKFKEIFDVFMADV